MWNDTKKKSTLYKEQNPEKVEAYLKEIEDILPEKIAYVDEAGIDTCLYREYAYALRTENKIFILANFTNICPFICKMC